MNETAKSKVSQWERVLERRRYWIGGAGLVLTVSLVVSIILYFEDIQMLGTYGYLGAFLIGIFGGATYIASVPVLPIIFVLGTVLKPSFAPYLGPVFVGTAVGLGETVGALTIYMTGYGGGVAIARTKHAKIRVIYSRILGWMERRGTLILFIFSAVINPFFYPIALTAGATHFDLKKYILICIVGKTIKGITVAAAGYWGLGSILRVLGVSI